MRHASAEVGHTWPSLVSCHLTTESSSETVANIGRTTVPLDKNPASGGVVCPSCGGDDLEPLPSGNLRCVPEDQIFGKNEIPGGDTLAIAAAAVPPRLRCPSCGTTRLDEQPNGTYRCIPEDKIFGRHEVDASARPAVSHADRSPTQQTRASRPLGRSTVPGHNYANLFIDAGISDRRDQERYGRYLDAAVAQEGIGVDDIVGVGEKGTGSRNDLYVIARQTIAHVTEIGMFSKRIEVRSIAPIAAISRLRGTQEGFKGTDITITANDASGGIAFKIIWGLGGPDWVEPLILRQRQHLFEVISKAMDSLSEAPRRPSVASASSKAGALMDWAADVVNAAGVPVSDGVVREHAMMAAGVIRMFTFLPLGGFDDLNKFYPNGEMPAGSVLETFDDLYEHVIARVGNARPVDQAIDKWLADNWWEYVNGCRQTYA